VANVASVTALALTLQTFTCGGSQSLHDAGVADLLTHDQSMTSIFCARSIKMADSAAVPSILRGRTGSRKFACHPALRGRQCTTLLLQCCHQVRGDPSHELSCLDGHNQCCSVLSRAWLQGFAAPSGSCNRILVSLNSRLRPWTNLSRSNLSCHWVEVRWPEAGRQPYQPSQIVHYLAQAGESIAATASSSCCRQVCPRSLVQHLRDHR